MTTHSIEEDRTAFEQGNDYFSALLRDFSRQAARDVVKHLLPNGYTTSEGVGRLKEVGRARKRKRAGEESTERLETATSQPQPSRKGLILSTLWPLRPAHLPYQPDAPSLPSALLDTASQLIRHHSLAFPSSKSGVRQKYLRVPEGGVEAVRRGGAWVAGRDLGDERGYRPHRSKGTAALTEEALLGGAEREHAEGQQDEEAERKSQYGDSGGATSLRGALSDSESDSEESDSLPSRPTFRPARVSPNPSSILSITTQQQRTGDTGTVSDDDEEDTDTDADPILPPHLATELTRWVIDLLVRLALATPEITGREFVHLKPMGWGAVVDAVAAGCAEDLKIALHAEGTLGAIYGKRDPDRRSTLVARHTSIQSARSAAQALEDRLCTSSISANDLLKPLGLPASPFRPLGPPIKKQRKKYTRRQQAANKAADGTAGGAEVPPEDGVVS